ncbi:GNAT family N-acetyltransferase [Amycolatopsis suaedae]|uniref:GNAT family N-acetyltransferase n=1 Tax=Amycolatopsis suaedae TaxID=2510978 RepID=A0A4Q7IZC6_9PSEU|nr:GNAT family N-acetyltransferase [Amycolatopsis suaedae]RZQ59788.1 GNAT family N-acetyltransferase [Amycolatopsis suaedae]
MSKAETRPATDADVAEIVRIQRDTWHAAYADILGQAALAALDSADAHASWAAAVADPATDVRVATEGSFTVGFCVSGLAPESEVADAAGTLPEDAERTGLVATVLVEPRWGRRGHGGRLLAAAAADLRARGALRGIGWLAQADSASLGLFRKAGWNPDGTVRTLDTGERTVREIRVTGSLDLTTVP